jgi:hypothetical protein
LWARNELLHYSNSGERTIPSPALPDRVSAVSLPHSSGLIDWNELVAADVVVAILTPAALRSSWVLQEMGADWGLRKPIIPVVTRRDVLNEMPDSIKGGAVIELADVESAANAENGSLCDDPKCFCGRPRNRLAHEWTQ